MWDLGASRGELHYGQSLGKVMLQPAETKRERGRTQDGKSVAPSLRVGERTVPEGARLLDLYQAATYTGLSYWTLRDWIADGILRVVKVPCGRHRRRGGVVARKAGDMSARKILIDRQDLDNMIEQCKETL